MEDQYTFDYPANKIIETWKYTNGETGTQIYSVKYNDRGYITVFDTDYEEDGYATSERNQGDRNFYTQYISSHLLKQIA